MLGAGLPPLAIRAEAAYSVESARLLKGDTREPGHVSLPRAPGFPPGPGAQGKEKRSLFLYAARGGAPLLITATSRSAGGPYKTKLKINGKLVEVDVDGSMPCFGCCGSSWG